MLRLLLATALLGAPFSTQGRTWTDAQGRTLEADYISATDSEVTVRRAADGRTFTLPLATLSAGDREFVTQQSTRSPATSVVQTSPEEFEQINALLGLPLLVDVTLWDDVPADIAQRLNLPLEGKNNHFEGYRGYAREPLPLLGAAVHMISLQAVEGHPTSLTFQFTNRGDYPAFRQREDRFSPPKAELNAFEQALKQDFDAITKTFTELLGAPKREIAVGGLDAGRRSLRWERGAHAFLVSHDEEQMVSLKIVPSDHAAAPRLADEQVRRLFKERINRRTNGDVVLDQIPMVNQGPKGYCVPATFERYLRYAGISADMYELAAVGGTDFGGGSSFNSMARSIDRFVRRQGRRLENPSLKLTISGIARYIDEGRPLIWGMYSTEGFNALADANTQRRQASTKLFDLTRPLTSEELASLDPDLKSAHACLIVGYNRKTNEVAVSDSWGPQFQERWVPVAAAQKVSQDEFWVLAW